MGNSLEDLMMGVMGISKEEFRQQQYERKLYERSSEYLLQKQKEEFRIRQQREEEYRRKLTKEYQVTDAVALNKTNLNKIIKWTSSCFNPVKKHVVIADILKMIQQGTDGVWEYGCGVYSEKSDGSGRDYRLVIYNGLPKIVLETGIGKQVWLLLKRDKSMTGKG